MLAFDTFGQIRSRLTPAISEMSFEAQQDEFRRRELLAIVQKEEEDAAKRERRHDWKDGTGRDAFSKVERQKVKEIEKQMGMDFCYGEDGQPIKMEKVKKIPNAVQPDVFLLEMRQTPQDPRHEDAPRQQRRNNHRKGPKSNRRQTVEAQEPAVQSGFTGFTPAPEPQQIVPAPGVRIVPRRRDAQKVDDIENRENINRAHKNSSKTMFSFDEEFKGRLHQQPAQQTRSSTARLSEHRATVPVMPPKQSKQYTRLSAYDITAGSNTTKSQQQTQQPLSTIQRNLATYKSDRSYSHQSHGHRPGIGALHRLGN